MAVPPVSRRRSSPLLPQQQSFIPYTYQQQGAPGVGQRFLDGLTVRGQALSTVPGKLGQAYDNIMLGVGGVRSQGTPYVNQQGRMAYPTSPITGREYGAKVNLPALTTDPPSGGMVNLPDMQTGSPLSPQSYQVNLSGMSPAWAMPQSQPQQLPPVNLNGPEWQAQNAQVLQAADQRMANINLRGQMMADRPANQYSRMGNPMDSTRQYVDQQMGALGYQQGAGINPALAAQQNRATDFRNGAGGAIGAGMANRFGAGSPLMPQPLAPGEREMQVGGYGSPMTRYQTRNPGDVLGEMRDKAVSGFDDRNYKGGYVLMNGALTNRQTFLREQAGFAYIAGDSETAARFEAEANQLDEANKGRRANMEAQQAEYRARRGGEGDTARRRRLYREKVEQRKLNKAGVSPLSPEASITAPTLSKRARDAMSGKVDSTSPLTNPFNADAPRTPENISTREAYKTSIFEGGTDAAGNATPPHPLFEQMNLPPEARTLKGVHDRLNEMVGSEGVELSDSDLQELHRFATSARIEEGDNVYDELTSPLSRFSENDTKLWKDLIALGEKPTPVQLREWAAKYKHNARPHGQKVREQYDQFGVPMPVPLAVPPGINKF